MKLKALIASLALVGSMSSAALADISVSARVRGSVSFQPTHSSVVVRDHRRTDTNYRPRHEPQIFVNNTKLGTYSEYIGPVGTVRRGYGLVALTEPTRIDRSREDFWIGASAGYIHSLQLRSVAGSSYIRKVTIEFANNEAQVVQLERTLDNRSGAINIDLAGNGRQIKRIFVYGSTADGSAYQIFAN